MKLLSDREANVLRGKLMVQCPPDHDVWRLLNHYTLIEHELDQLDGEDYFGTEGWRHQFGIPEDQGR